MDTLRLQQLLRQAVYERVAPGIALGISRGNEAPVFLMAGRTSHDSSASEITAETNFDLASLTKPLTTTLWCLRLMEEKRMNLEDTLGRFIPALGVLKEIPIWRLLNHTSGLPSHRPYFRGLGGALLGAHQLGDSARRSAHARAKATVRRMILETELEHQPGQAEIYSDLGFLLLEWVLEVIDGQLNAQWPTLPEHGDGGLHFLPSGADPQGVYASTEVCPLRQRLLTAEVHDENGWVVGGVAGHAGLFGSISATHTLAQRILLTLKGADTGLGISPSLLRKACHPRWMHPAGTRVLGWDTPTPGASSAGRLIARQSIGHLGFTGTSVWLDPLANIAVTLLTNRVCPTRENIRIRTFRPRIHEAIWQQLAPNG